MSRPRLVWRDMKQFLVPFTIYTIVCCNECLNRYVSCESSFSKQGEHKGVVGNDIKCLWRNNKVLISCTLLFSSLFYSSSSSSPPRKINTCTWSPQVLLLFRLIKSRTVTVLDSVTSEDLLTHDVIFKRYCYLQHLACCCSVSYAFESWTSGNGRYD